MTRPTEWKRLARMLAALLLGIPAGRAVAEDAPAPVAGDYGFRLADPGSAALFLEIPPCSDEDAWAQASATGTQDAIRAYMQAFPDGCHFAEAAARVTVAVTPTPTQVRRTNAVRRQEARRPVATVERTDRRQGVKKRRPATTTPTATTTVRRHY